MLLLKYGRPKARFKITLANALNTDASMYFYLMAVSLALCYGIA
jgi:hypothetical protein